MAEKIQSKERGVLIKLVADMSDTYNSSKSLGLFQRSPFPGEILAVKLKRSWYRGRVTGTDQEQSRLQIFFVDLGLSKFDVSLDDVRILEAQFLRLHFQVRTENRILKFVIVVGHWNVIYDLLGHSPHFVSQHPFFGYGIHNFTTLGTLFFVDNN